MANCIPELSKNWEIKENMKYFLTSTILCLKESGFGNIVTKMGDSVKTTIHDLLKTNDNMDHNYNTNDNNNSDNGVTNKVLNVYLNNAIVNEINKLLGKIIENVVGFDMDKISKIWNDVFSQFGQRIKDVATKFMSSCNHKCCR